MINQPHPVRRMDEKRYNFKFIDLFAGIGGFHRALAAHGGDCMLASEIDRFAQKTYQTNFEETRLEGDIKDLIDRNQIPPHDILCGGFPCQPFSIAGVSKYNALGYEHGFSHKTKGTLFFEIVRILEQHRPVAFILENVKNLRSHDRGRTFRTIIDTLQDELDYEVFDRTIDARHVVPQHRERVFLVGFDRKALKWSRREEIAFDFPAFDGAERKQLQEILEKNVDPKYTLTDHLWNYLQAYAEKHRSKGNGFGYGLVDPEESDVVTRTLSARYYKDGSEILIYQGRRKNPRRLTPRECARLMGFPDEHIIPVSDTQAYKQFGNAVVMPVVRAIAREVLQTLASFGLIEERSEGKQVSLFPEARPPGNSTSDEVDTLSAVAA